MSAFLLFAIFCAIIYISSLMQYSTGFCHTRHKHRRHRKDLDNIKTAPKEKFTHTPTQLKNLVEAAQKGSREAIDRLCHDFAPLIYKEARRSNVQGALGEDAVNTAWVIFLEFIQRYKGNNYRLLPGLVQKHVHYKLLDRLHQKGCLLDCDALDADDNAKAAIVDKRDYFAESIERLSMDKAVCQLTKKQRELIKAIDYDGIDIKTYSIQHNCSRQNIHQTHKSALNRLKEFLEY